MSLHRCQSARPTRMVVTISAREQSVPGRANRELRTGEAGAAEAAAELVEDGMTVGLGTGTTVGVPLPALARRSLDIRCVATSPRTERAARELGLRVNDFTGIDRFDLTIDGADQISPEGWLVKGGGAAHTREKIVAAAADRFVSSRTRPSPWPPSTRRYL